MARPDEDELVKPAAYVVLKAPEMAGERTEEALREHCKSGLAPYKYPRWLTFVEELPKTATGKIRRFELRAKGDVGAG